MTLPEQPSANSRTLVPIVFLCFIASTERFLATATDSHKKTSPASALHYEHPVLPCSESDSHSICSNQDQVFLQSVSNTSSLSSVDFSQPGLARGCRGGGLGSRSKKLSSSCNPELESAKFDYITDCCINRCLWQFSLQTVIASRAFYQHMSQAEQENWLAAMTAAWIVWHSGVQQQVVPCLSGLIVCCRAVCLMYGI